MAKTIKFTRVHFVPVCSYVNRYTQLMLSTYNRLYPYYINEIREFAYTAVIRATTDKELAVIIEIHVLDAFDYAQFFHTLREHGYRVSLKV